MVASGDHLSALFHALADPTRRQMLECLRRGALAVGELAAEFPMSRPAISKHLAVLEEAGLVTAAKEGRRRMYESVLEPLTEIEGWLRSCKRRAERPAPLDRNTGSPQPQRAFRSAASRSRDDWKVW